eukprot:1670355-Rhodomonas_salina.3
MPGASGHAEGVSGQAAVSGHEGAGCGHAGCEEKRSTLKAFCTERSRFAAICGCQDRGDTEVRRRTWGRRGVIEGGGAEEGVREGRGGAAGRRGGGAGRGWRGVEGGGVRGGCACDDWCLGPA